MHVRWIPAFACVALLAVGVAGAEDIMGPMEPAEAPVSRRPVRRAVAALLAVGFVAVGGYWLLRRRRRHRAPAPAPLTELPDREELSGLDSAEFYGRLLTAARECVSDGVRPATLTPRELARMGPSNDGWQAMCRRAERARYAGEQIGAAERDEDLALVREMLAASREKGEGT